ncbi:MAG: MBOAT family O-acyltransferase [Eubacterium sp.]
MISYTSFAFFIIYFGITYLIYSIVPQKAKWCILLIGSYFFYFIAAKGHVIQLIAASIIVWAIGLWLQKLNDDFKAKKKGMSRDERKKLKKKYASFKQAVLALGVISTLGILLVCKYSNFFIDTANVIFNSNFENINIIQPLGISFYTLQAISYITDISRGKYPAEKNPLRVSLYLSFMLTIVEGPVARYNQLGLQLNECKRFGTNDLVYGAQRVVWGLFKKIVIADRAAEFVNAVFNNSADYKGIAVAAAILFYTMQLYLEFSGVMDVVCGFGEMLGINLPENFNRPFFAKTINEFWQRWHITLGGWLRDYIFYPISLSKPFMSLSKSARKKLNSYYANLIPTAVALFFVWFANGFWHGSGWKYIVYGLYYYVLMMIGLFLEPLFRKICSFIRIDRESKLFHVFQMIRTFIIVNIGMLIFRADDLKQAWSMFISIFEDISITAVMPGQKNGFGLDIKDYIIIIAGVIIVFTVSLLAEKGIDLRKKISKLPYIVKFIIYLIMIFTVIIFGAYGEGYGVVDLIYANF